jgi:hypothetical protein
MLGGGHRLSPYFRLTGVVGVNAPCGKRPEDFLQTDEKVRLTGADFKISWLLKQPGRGFRLKKDNASVAFFVCYPNSYRTLLRSERVIAGLGDNQLMGNRD